MCRAATVQCRRPRGSPCRRLVWALRFPVRRCWWFERREPVRFRPRLTRTRRETGVVLALIGVTISLHVAGMYTPAPLFGFAADRFGRLPAAAVGYTMIIGCRVLPIIGDGEAVMVVTRSHCSGPVGLLRSSDPQCSSSTSSPPECVSGRRGAVISPGISPLRPVEPCLRLPCRCRRCP